MSRGKVMGALIVAAVAAAGFIGQALSQESRPARTPRDPAQMRQQMSDRQKEQLGATDEEWKILQPKIEKVQTLSRQTRGGGMTGRMGARGGRAGGQPADAAAPAATPQSDVATKMADLQKVLQNKDAKPDEIKTALTALRDARAKAKEELEKAQKELREVVTVRQEAQLVTMGVLD